MKIALVGVSGSGKSSLGKSLAHEHSLPFFELDSFFHQRDWTPKGDAQFKTDIEEILANNPQGWVIDGNYFSKLGTQVLDSADIVIWFNLPRRVVMYRIIKRSIVRVLLRKELWNGNREKLHNLLSSDPESNVILWAWTQHAEYEKTLKKLHSEANSNQKWIEIRSSKILPWTILGSNQ